jgi:hypothetical protein
MADNIGCLHSQYCAKNAEHDSHIQLPGFEAGSQSKRYSAGFVEVSGEVLESRNQDLATHRQTPRHLAPMRCSIALGSRSKQRYVVLDDVSSLLF